MPDNIVLILVVLFFTIVILSVIVYNIMRFMRGSIRLDLPGTTFNPGEIVRGSFVLHIRRTIQGNRLIVNLIGEQVTETRERGESRTRSTEIYRDEKLIEDARVYPGSLKTKYVFDITLPNTHSSDFLNSPVGRILSAAMRFTGNRRTYIRWKIEVCLEAKGIDLTTSKRIKFNV